MANLWSAAVNGTLKVKVRPSARRTQLVKVEDGVAHIDLAAAAEDGKANVELERFVRRETGLQARIVSGATTRRKLLRLK